MADPLSMAASIAGIISLADALYRQVYKFARTAIGAKEEVQLLANEVNAFSGVLRTLEALANELESAGQAFEPALQVDHLTQCRRVFEKIQTRVVKAVDSFNNRSRLEGIARQLKWPFSASETRDLLQQLSRCKDSITLATSADTMRNLQLCLMRQEQHGDTLSKISESLKKVEIQTSILVDPRKQLVLDFFMPPAVNPQAKLDQSIKLRQPTTGEWLTHSFGFTEWLHTPGSRLWLNGIPGGGKTVIAGAIIQAAIMRSGTESDVAVAFFFCDYKQESTLTPVNILGSIASQLAIQRDDTFELLQAYYYELHPARALNKPADPNELVGTITSMCDLLRQVIIVVDGLDECGDGIGDVLEVLSDLTGYTTTTSIALLSRNDVEIKQVLEDNFKQIPIEAHTEDLDIYVRAEMERRIRAKQLDLQNLRIKDEIHHQLVSRANGMFRWVVCQLDYLSELITDADRRLALNELPPTLPETYLRLLERINKRPLRVRKMVQNCLQFIAFFPPIPIEALCQALSTPEIIGAKLDETNTVSERDIALCCSSLIRKTVDGKSFEFAHFSVREFLEHESLSQPSELATYRLIRSDGKGQLALQCLRFLQMSNFDEKFLADFLSDSHESGSDTSLPSFYPHAAFCLLHLTTVGFHNAPVLDAAKSLFHSPASPNFLLWTYVALGAAVEYNLITTTGDFFEAEVLNDAKAKIRASVLDGSLCPLHLACILNLPEICSMLLLQGVSVNIECALGTPLLLAEMSLPGVLRKLSGLYPGRNSIIFSRFLPSSSRRIETIDCLVSAGASFTCLDRPIGSYSLLYIVAIMGCHLKDFEQVITLLDHGIIPQNDEITAFGDYLETWSGFDDCQELAAPLLKLFDYMMRSSVYDSNWGFKLGEELWKTAIALGFDFTNNTDLTDSRISLATEALVEKTFQAFINDDTATLQLCLKDGRVNVFSEYGSGVLLQHAVEYDALNCVRLLLELGSDIHRKTKSGDPIIHFCDQEGDGSVLKLLVGHEALLLAHDQNGCTLWHLCASSNICNMSFLDALFNIDQQLSQRALLMKTKEGPTPLMLALTAVEGARKDDLDAAENKAVFFLDYCQKLPHFWEKHETIFPRAVQTESRKVLQHVVELGLMPDSTQPCETTPLHNLGANATHEWTEYLKNIYPGALSLRFENRLPLELYIERVARAGKPHWCDVLHALAPLDFLGLKDCEGVTVWEFVCQLKHQARRWETSGYFLEAGYKDLDHVYADLLSTKAMEAYEIETGQCGVLLLLSSSSWVSNFSMLISHGTLDQSIRLSTLWDPKDEAAVRFLKRAIQDSDGAKVELLIKHGLNVHQRESGTSPIECACQPEVARELCSSEDGITILQCLLDHSIPERLREFSADPDAISLLHRLAMRSPPECIGWLLRQLVDKGADLNAINPDTTARLRMTPLAWHLESGSFHSAALLLELGADPLFTGPGEPGSYWQPFDALTWAVHVGSRWFLEKLHTYSTKRCIKLNWTPKTHIKVKSREKEPGVLNVTLFHLPCIKGNLGAVQLYVEQALIEDIDLASDNGFTPLHCSAMYNRATIMEYLISNGASINLQTESGASALHLAASWGHAESTELLLRLGASNLIDHNEQTARMLAYKHGHGSIIDILDKQFGDPGSSRDMSPDILVPLTNVLGKAIKSGNIDECKRLFACGHPLDKPMPTCQPGYPLLFAVACNQVEIAQWLLDNGVSVMVNVGDVCPPERSFSVLEEVTRREAALPLLPTILVRYHEEGGCWYRGYDLPLHWAAANNNLEGLRLILEYLVDNAAAISDRSCLSRKDVVHSILNRQYLRSYGGDTWQGATALHFAVRRGHIACAEFLLSNGVDPDDTNIYGQCPLEYTSDPEMATLLLQHGASPLPVLLRTFNDLLKGWASNYTALITLFNEAYTKGLGIQLWETLDLAASSFTKEGPYSLKAWADQDPLSVIRVTGFDSTDTSYGHGYLLNHVVFGCGKLHGFLLNSQISSETLQPLPWHWFGPYGNFRLLRSDFNRFRRRFIDQDLTRWLNLQPDRGWSPLCRAASEGLIRVMDNCLLIGADIEFEGCPLGSALMIASACGRLEAVKLLVRKGAATSYVGRIGPINVFSVTRSKKVKAWLLVGRFNDRLRLNTSGDPETARLRKPISYWSGIVQARYKLVTWTLRHASESALEYAKRLNWIKRNSFPDGIVSPVDGFIYPQNCSRESSTADPDHETNTPGQNTQVNRAKSKESEACNGHVEGGNDMNVPESDEAHYEESVSAQGTYDSPGLSGFVVTLRGEIDLGR